MTLARLALTLTHKELACLVYALMQEIKFVDALEGEGLAMYLSNANKGVPLDDLMNKQDCKNTLGALLIRIGKSVNANAKKNTDKEDKNPEA